MSSNYAQSMNAMMHYQMMQALQQQNYYGQAGMSREQYEHEYNAQQRYNELHPLAAQSQASTPAKAPDESRSKMLLLIEEGN
jgi:hypothetical protein